jgi:hypothetical protein
MLESVSEFLQASLVPLLSSILGADNFLVNLISNQPLLLLAFLVLPAIILLVVALFVDFMKDSWRLAVGALFDILAIYIFVVNPLMLVVLALAAGITFHFFGENEIQHKIYTTLSVLRILVLLPFIPIPENLKIILVLAPICTLLTFFRCITD